MSKATDDLDEEFDLRVALPMAGGGHAFECRALKNDAEAGTTSLVLSTAAVDRADDVVDQSWRLAAYRRNPVVLEGHNRSVVVGKGESVTVPRQGDDAGRLVGVARWDLESPDPVIRAIGHQHLQGFRSAVSVGFRAGKVTRRDKLPTDHPHYSAGREVDTPWGSRTKVVGKLYERNTLLEFSSVSIPMNPEALQRQLFDELAERDPADLEGRAKVVGDTVPRAVAVDLVDLVRALGDEARFELAGLLLPDLLSAMRADHDSARRVLRAVLDTGRAAPPTMGPLARIFTSPATGKE